MIDDRSTDYTSAPIRQAGFRCIRGERNRKKPGAIRTLLDALPPEVAFEILIPYCLPSRLPGLQLRFSP